MGTISHLLYALSKSMGSAIARQRRHRQKQQQAWQAKLRDSSAASRREVEAQITALQAQQQQIETDHQDYQQSLHALSQAIHPFDLNTGESQLGLELPARLQAHLSTLERLSQIYAPTQSEGRNGYLSGLHHANRGLTEQTLKVLTIGGES